VPVQGTAFYTGCQFATGKNDLVVLMSGQQVKPATACSRLSKQLPGTGNAVALILSSTFNQEEQRS
jgi:hypothetical protein